MPLTHCLIMHQTNCWLWKGSVFPEFLELPSSFNFFNTLLQLKTFFVIFTVGKSLGWKGCIKLRLQVKVPRIYLFWLIKKKYSLVVHLFHLCYIWYHLVCSSRQSLVTFVNKHLNKINLEVTDLDSQVLYNTPLGFPNNWPTYRTVWLVWTSPYSEGGSTVLVSKQTQLEFEYSWDGSTVGPTWPYAARWNLQHLHKNN